MHFLIGNLVLFCLVQIQRECKLDVNVEEYVESTCKPYLMDVIFCWSKVDFSVFTIFCLLQNDSLDILPCIFNHSSIHLVGLQDKSFIMYHSVY